MAGQSVVLGSLKYILGFDSLAFQEGLGDAEKRLKASQRSIQRTADKFKDIGGALTLGVSAPLAAFGVSAFKAASDAAELQSAFNTTFGNMSATMDKWAEDTGNALGRSTQEMKRAANTFGIFFNTAVDPRKAAAMSQTFAKLAQDLGSFYNVDTETAIEKLRSGLSGESEPLRDFGVFLTEASVKAKALELGLTGVGNELTEQEKIAARYALIMEQTTKAQGDVERTSAGTANQIRRAQAAFEELQIIVGTKLLPVLTPLIEKIASALDWFTRLPAPVQNFAIGLGAVAAALGPVALAAGSLLNILSPLFARMALASAAAGIPALTLALGPLAVAALAVVAAWRNWEKIGPWIDGVVTRSKKASVDISNAFKAVNDWADNTDRRLGTPTRAELFASIGAWLKKTWDTANTYDLGKWAAQVDAKIAAFASNAVASMQRMYTGIKTWLVDKLGAIWQTAKNGIQAVADKFKWLDDVVVRNSYIPDMVDSIGEHMGRLNNNMVRVAQTAVAKVGESFRLLEADVRPIMERLFPERERMQQWARELATVNSSRFLSAADKAEAGRRLADDFGSGTAEAAAGAVFGITAGIGGVADQTATIVNDKWQEMIAANDNLKSSFEGMVRDISSSLQNFGRSVREGGFLEILGSAAELGLSVFSAFKGGGSGKFGGFRAAGGPIAAGRSYVVGEQGPELFTARRSGYITPNKSISNDVGPRRIEVVPSPYFNLVVDGRAYDAAGTVYKSGSGAAARRGRQRLA